jgi:Phage capsid protein
MASASAPVTLYPEEYISTFERRKSLLLSTVTTQFTRKGNTVTFLVAGSGGATAKTRGINGLIPARSNSNTQTSATLQEWHDLVENTDFNIFQSQANQREIMQMESVGTINRKIDDDIITELGTATVTPSATAATASLELVMHAKTILGVNQVPWDGNLNALVSPAFEAYLMQTKEFSSREYINNPTMPNADPAWKDQPTMYRWLGINWIVHPGVTGVGTSAEKCWIYHKSAIGYAADIRGMNSSIGYDEKQMISWARASVYMAPKLLQNSGVVEINHDGSAYAAA